MKTDLHWEKIGKHPHHGICVPLFSLQSQSSLDGAEFLDLLPLIDWCKKVGFDCIQLLPLFDTGQDLSPYNPLSAFALHPIYISLVELGLKPQKKRDKIAALRNHFSSTFPTLKHTDSYQSFVSQNPWLIAYSKFKALKELHQHRHWLDWPKDAKADPTLCDFYTFLQFHAYRQMEQVRAHADIQAIFLKGDIPILLSPDSADVWENPSQFLLSIDAGAPPDAYNPRGQHWGFPLFDWEAMEKDDYRWWKNRLQTAEKLYHIYRIDHVVGLFRMWGIPKGKKPTEGSFFPSDPTLWPALGSKRLEMMIDASSMLPIAEDLGTIPPEVYPILKDLGICGTKVIRWQRREHTYIPFREYEPFSLTTLSTPDMDSLELWWKLYPNEAAPLADYLNIPYHPILSAPFRLQILQAAHLSSSLFHINLLQEYLNLFPELASKSPEEERINVPGTILPTNWTYRFRPAIEQIAAHEGLAQAIAQILGK